MDHVINFDGAGSEAQPRPLVPKNSGTISALVCTRNRGDKILQTINSILANEHSNFKLLVVDQSTDDLSELALRHLSGDDRFRYLRTPTKGLGLARDIGIRASEADYVAITDDDCDVPTDWLISIQQVFDKYRQVAVIYCDVQPGPHDHMKGLIPHLAIRTNRLITRLMISQSPGIGIGAGMAVRRDLIIKLGGSDHGLGAGTLLPGAEDVDLGYRALLSGFHVFQLADAGVIHHGFRTFEQYRDLLSGYLAGTTAMYIKLIRLGHYRAAGPLIELIYLMIIKPFTLSVFLLRRPPIKMRLIGVLTGIRLGLAMTINTDGGVFRINTDAISKH